MKRINRDFSVKAYLNEHGWEEGVLWKGQVSVRGGRIKALVFVAKSRKVLRNQWKKIRGSGLGYGCVAAVNNLMQIECIEKDGVHEFHDAFVDPHYFCLMGFAAPDIDLNTVVHESVHAAFAYANRFRPDPQWQYGVEQMPEEQVCYVAGEITEVLCDVFYRDGFLKKSFK